MCDIVRFFKKMFNIVVYDVFFFIRNFKNFDFLLIFSKIFV